MVTDNDDIWDSTGFKCPEFILWRGKTSAVRALTISVRRRQRKPRISPPMGHSRVIHMRPQSSCPVNTTITSSSRATKPTHCHDRNQHRVASS